MNQDKELIAKDIQSYLALHEQKELVRFITCGSVDDGKSTLIGRLLHDSKVIYEDQLASVRNDSKRLGTTGEDIDLALLVDGLQSEREQGITIDVAYRYFSTTARKFIIADTPGHEQYTRNMATGASTADLAVILIDARYGVQTQTRRHSFIASLLGINHRIIAINKMDLVNYSEVRFNEIQADYLAFAKTLDKADLHFIPLSALKGDNVVHPSTDMPWYQGKSLIRLLDTINLDARDSGSAFRFPVQYVNRPNPDFRGFAGTVASGVIAKGDEVRVLPSGKSARVKEIVTWDGNLAQAFAGQSVTLTLDKEIDISRGDMLVKADANFEPTRSFDAKLVWMDDAQLVTGRSYTLKLATTSTNAVVNRIYHRIDVNSLKKSNVESLSLNEIAQVEISAEQSLPIDDYQSNRQTGAFILIDKLTNSTVAAGMISNTNKDKSVITVYAEPAVSVADRALRLGQKARIIGLPDASDELVFTLERALFERGRIPVVSDSLASANSLREAGLIVLIRTTESADWVVSTQRHSDLILNTSLSTEQQVKLILESLTQMNFI